MENKRVRMSKDLLESVDGKKSLNGVILNYDTFIIDSKNLDDIKIGMCILWNNQFFRISSDNCIEKAKSFVEKAKSFDYNYHFIWWQYYEIISMLNILFCRTKKWRWVDKDNVIIYSKLKNELHLRNKGVLVKELKLNFTNDFNEDVIEDVGNELNELIENSSENGRSNNKK